MVENNKRSRKPNFTAAECALICDAAEQNLSVIKSKFSSALTNKNKTKVWEDITARVNSLGVCLRSVAEVKDKWRGMVSTAKKEHTKYAASQRQTGGGKKPASPVSATKKSSTCLGKTPHFPVLLAASNQVNKPQFRFSTGPAVAGQTINYCYLKSFLCD